MKLVRRSSAAQQLRHVVRKKRGVRLTRSRYLSTGCTLLNLALSDRVDGGYLAGKYFFLVGDSGSGKTFFSMTCFAEALRHPFFKDCDLYYDNTEDGMLMDVRRLFGSGVEERVKPPALDKKGKPVWSETVEQFYYHVDDAIKLSRETGRPFIYVLDSMDGLDTDDDQKKFDEHKEAHRKGKVTAGSYGMAKAKKNSVGLRKVQSGLRATGSILILISQTRDNPNAMPWEPKKTRAGGKALRFYATAEIWTAQAGAEAKTIHGRKRKIGTKVALKTVKNRITGDLHDFKTMIYPSYGVDDTGSLIDYLIEEKVWKKVGTSIKAGKFGKLSRDKLIATIEDGRQEKLMEIVQRCWNDVKTASAVSRKPRYS